jgi:hypothetical protein
MSTVHASWFCKGIKIKTNITKDGWSANVVDKKDKIQIKIGE